MSFQRSEMLYDNGYYKWSAASDHDDPYSRGGTDYKELNRTEGYEVLYSVNHFVNKHYLAIVAHYQKAERMIRYDVPAAQKSHRMISE